MLDHWNEIGIIMQATQIDDGKTYPVDVYLEVQSQLKDGPPELAAPTPWPMVAGTGTATRKPK